LFLHFNGALALYWHSSGRTHFVLSNLFILGYNSLRKLPLVPAWSLDIEMQFYLIAPLLAISIARVRIPKVSILAMAAAISLASVYLHAPSSILSYIPFFLIGMIAACANWRPSSREAMLSLGATALFVIGCLASPWRGILLIGAHPGPLAIYSPYANITLALVAVPYAIYTTTQKGFKADGMFADLSYITYLLHWIATLWLRSHTIGVAQRLESTVVAWIGLIGSSFLIWKYYDHPINQMRSRWVNERRKVNLTSIRELESKQTEAITPLV